MTRPEAAQFSQTLEGVAIFAGLHAAHGVAISRVSQLLITSTSPPMSFS
jgi:hypothetical protein